MLDGREESGGLFALWLLFAVLLAIACSGRCAPQGATLQGGRPLPQRPDRQAQREACRGLILERARCAARVPY